MAKDAQKSTKKSQKRIVVIIVLSLIFAVMLKMTFIFLFLGMLPAMVAYINDHDKNKYTSYTVAALNFSGVFPYVIDIFSQGGTLAAIKNRLSDPIIWFVMYGSAGLGWIIVHCSPVIAAVVIDGLYKTRILHLEILQKKAVEEWGKEVVGRDE